MNWKLKARVQSAIARLPDKLSYPLYYAIQRGVGTLRSVEPTAGLLDGLRLVDAIRAAGRETEGASVLEVGTGQRLNVPIALWLCGVRSIVTADRTWYLRSSLVRRELTFIRTHRATIEAMFRPHARPEFFEPRFALLTREGLRVPALLAAAGIEYVQRDVRTLPLADRSVDIHLSNNVLEHVPRADLVAILREGARIVREDGLLVHRVDFSDHFAEADARITTVNFLQFSDDEWERLAGNDFNYHNRLRIDEFADLVVAAGLKIVAEHREVDPAALRALVTGFPLDPRFASKPLEVNATATAVVIMQLGTRHVPQVG